VHYGCDKEFGDLMYTVRLKPGILDKLVGVGHIVTRSYIYTYMYIYTGGRLRFKDGLRLENVIYTSSEGGNSLS
jgi:hypothetical protein